MIKCIVRDICRIGILHIGVMIFLSQRGSDAEYQKFRPRKSFRRFIGQGVSLTYEFPTFLVLDYSMSSGTFVKEHKMFLPIHQINKVLTFLQKTIKIVDDPQGRIYYWDADHGNTLSMYHMSSDELNRLIVIESGFAGNHRLQSYPTIVKDYQENLYEGAVISFDRVETSVQLSYDELRSLLYILSRTDFVVLSQTMINTTKIWTDQVITKHLDIETSKSGDYRQKNDLAIAESKTEQPKPMFGGSVFNGLKTRGDTNDND